MSIPWLRPISMRSVRLLVWGFWVFLSLSSFELAAQGPLTDGSAEADREIAEVQLARWSNAKPMLFVAPYYSLEEGSSATLLLVNRFADIIRAEVTAFGLAGERYPLGSWSLLPRSPMEIDLVELVSIAGPGFRQGSLHVAYFGDDEMVQAWLVLEGPKGVIELPLRNQTDPNPSDVVASWDLRAHFSLANISPRFAVHNAEGAPVLVHLRSYHSDSARSWDVEIPGYATYLLDATEPAGRMSRSFGALRVFTGGSPARVSVTGFLSGTGFLSRLPVGSVAQLSGWLRYDSVTLPLAKDFSEAQDRGQALRITLFGCSEDEPRAVTVTTRLLEVDSGDAVVTDTRRLAPGEVITFDILGALLSKGPTDRPLRLRVESDAPCVQPSGLVVRRDATPIDVALIPHQHAHDGGTYPLPSLKTHEVVTTFLNVGDLPAHVAAFVDWGTGSYSLKPFTIPPEGGYRLDFSELAEHGAPDVLGREFDGEYEEAYLQWSARSGSRKLIARTEVRPRSGADWYGFNCFGCCYEIPWGEIIPAEVSFDIGGTRSFETVEWLNTCSGIVGPFSTEPDTLIYEQPVSWNGAAVSSSNLTNQDPRFTDSGDYMWTTCTLRHRTFGGAGRVTVDECAKEHNPDYKPVPGGCHAAENSSNCSGCYSCCEKEKAVADCRCAKIGQNCQNSTAIACGNCKQQCIGQYLDDCTQPAACSP